MTMHSKSIFEVSLPTENTSRNDFRLPEAAIHHDTLHHLSISAGLYSHGCDTEFSLTSGVEDFRTSLSCSRHF